MTARALTVLAATVGTILSFPAFAAADEAHAEAGPNVPLLVAGGIVLVGSAVLLIARRGPRWLGIGGVVVAAALGTLGFTLGGGTDAPSTDAVVSIVEPEDGAAVPARRPVTIAVKLENGTVARSPRDEEGGHLHLYVDGDLQQMPYSKRIEVELAPGPHNLTVEYVDHQHVSFDPPVQTSITVTARQRS